MKLLNTGKNGECYLERAYSPICSVSLPFVPSFTVTVCSYWGSYRVMWSTHLFIYFAVLGLELRAYTLSHSTSPFL
jgi:hypothetical protein